MTTRAIYRFLGGSLVARKCETWLCRWKERTAITSVLFRKRSMEINVHQCGFAENGEADVYDR